MVVGVEMCHLLLPIRNHWNTWAQQTNAFVIRSDSLPHSSFTRLAVLLVISPLSGICLNAVCELNDGRNNCWESVAEAGGALGAEHTRDERIPGEVQLALRLAQQLCDLQALLSGPSCLLLLLLHLLRAFAQFQSQLLYFLRQREEKIHIKSIHLNPKLVHFYFIYKSFICKKKIIRKFRLA